MEADYQKAANTLPVAAKETEEVTPKIRGTKTTRTDEKGGTKTTPHPTAAFTQELANSLGKEGWNPTFPRKSLVKSADGEGFEPTVLSHGNSDFSTQAARNPARTAMETLLLELWNAASDSAKLQSLELLRLNPSSDAE